MRRSYKDKAFCLTKVEENAENYDKVAEELKEDREIVLAAVGHDKRGWACIYENLPEKYRSDKEITVAAVRCYGYNLRFASDEMKADREVVGYAVDNYGWALTYSPEDLRNDKELILQAVKSCWNYYEEGLSEEQKKDREIVLAALKSSWRAWEYVPEEFKHDKEIALEYVRSGGKYGLPKELEGDYDIAMEWANQGEDKCLWCADDKWNNDRVIVMTCVSKNGKAYEYASKRLRVDLEVAITAAKTAPVCVMKCAPEELKWNKCFVRYLVEQDPDALVDAPEKYKHDPEILAVALKHIDTEIEIGYWYRPRWLEKMSPRDIQAALNYLDEQEQETEKECA